MAVGDAGRMGRKVVGIWTHHQALLIGLAIVLFGAGLRLWAVDINGFNTDEVFSIWLAEKDPAAIVQYTVFGDEDNPPFFFVLLHFLLLFGDQALVVRLISILAGIFTVWLTFQLALFLFDIWVAALGGFLVAISPLLVAYSLVARAYMLSSCMALLSLYCLARILFGETRKRYWAGLVAGAVAAVWTFYLAVIIVLFEIACVVYFWLRRWISRSTFVSWVFSQLVLFVLILPALVYMLTQGPHGQRESWLDRPNLQSLIRGVILFSTGDPSYGPISVTPTRVLSLVTVLGLVVLGLWLFRQRGYFSKLDDEGRRVLFLVCAFAIPWALALMVSQLRPIYKEKYFLFVIPLLLITVAWILIRARHMVVTFVVGLALVGLTGISLHVYYTEPTGEQWREAVDSLRSSYQESDLIAISPGFYSRPIGYYLHGQFPSDAESFDDASSVVLQAGQFRVLDWTSEPRLSAEDREAAARAWLVSGYAPSDPRLAAWFEEDYTVVDSADLVGVHVSLGERVRSSSLQENGVEE